MREWKKGSMRKQKGVRSKEFEKKELLTDRAEGGRASK
jgi:hypothetical protein